MKTQKTTIGSMKGIIPLLVMVWVLACTTYSCKNALESPDKEAGALGSASSQTVPVPLDTRVSDSLDLIRYSKEIAGIYKSNQAYSQMDARTDEEKIADPMPDISFQTITIKQGGYVPRVTQNFSGDPGPAEGCDGSLFVDAEAEIVKIEKTQEGVYILHLDKVGCHYYNGGEYACEGFVLDYEEGRPTSNGRFTLKLNRKDASRIRMETTARKTPCKGAWELSEYTFRLSR